MSVGDWMGALTPEERADWDEFVKHAEDGLQPNMESSAFVMSLIPDEDKVDIKFAVELGMAIMLNKPIIALVAPGVTVPSNLIQVATDIIVADVKTTEGQQEVARRISALMEKLAKEKENDPDR